MPSAELLETRDAPAVLTVTSNADNGGAGQLRKVLASSHNGDTINFNLPAGQNVITLASEIDTNVTNLTINGGNANARVTITAPNSRALFFGDPNPKDTHIVSETIQYITFTNCGANVNVVEGGAIALDGSLTMSNCFFTSNATTFGGAIWVETNGWNGDAISITNTQFRSNTAAKEGGALYFEGDGPPGSDGVAGNDGGWITLTGDSFTQNTATAGSGGAICTGDPTAASTFVAADCMFQNNTAGANGGAIYTTYQLTIEAKDSVSEFSNNTAAALGGAIYWRNAVGTVDTSVTLLNLTFGSSALTAHGANNAPFGGGAVWLGANMTSAAATETVTGCLFNGNQSTNNNGDGGGLLISNTTTNTGSSSLNVANSTFFGNIVGNDGGGIYIGNANTGTAGNTATLTSLTVYDNSAFDKGGGLWVDAPAGAGRVRINNSIIAGNITNGQGADVFGTAILSQGFNFIGVFAGSGGWNANDLRFGGAGAGDPGLAAPQDKGGKTLVIDVPMNNIARRAGNPALWDTLDQRGLTRNFQSNPNDPNTKKVTIGAYDPDAS